VDTDAKIEPFWKSARSNEICEQLKLLEPTLITTPNSSLLANVPRHDNLINMKRIAVAWAELSQAGHAVALHVNARTERDWQRWLHFILEQRAVHWLAFELDTGARINGKWRYYTQQLAWLASKANRPLNLITRGSFGVGTLRSAFAQVTLLDSNAFSKTRSRMRAALVNGRVRWHRGFTLIGQPIDSLLQHNVDLQMSVSSSAAQSP
jgi:hypothetical protein